MKKIPGESFEDLIRVLAEEAFLSIENEREARLMAAHWGELVWTLEPLTRTWH